jgi:hypothetical protein
MSRQPLGREMTTLAHLHIDWIIGGCVGMALASVTAYRVVTRLFGWGPDDT